MENPPDLLAPLADRMRPISLDEFVGQEHLVGKGNILQTIIKQDTKVLYARLRQSDFTVADAAWIADFDDPMNFLYLLKSDTGQQNYGDYSNPEYDALLARSNAELDLHKRAETFAEAETLMLNDYPITPMWFQVNKNLVDPTLTGFVDNAKDKHRSRFICRDGMKPAE